MGTEQNHWHCGDIFNEFIKTKSILLILTDVYTLGGGGGGGGGNWQ